MSRSGGDITVRLGVRGAEEVKRALQGMGREGERALKQIERAQREAGPGARAMAAALDGLHGEAQALGRDVPVLSGALRALGPLGGVVATGIGAAAAAVAGLVATAGPMMQWAAELTDVSQALEIGTEQLQVFRFAMEEAGGEAPQLDEGLRGLMSTIGALRTGLGDTRQLAALQELRLDPELLTSAKSSEEALRILIERFQELPSAADQVRIAERLNIAALLPLLRAGSEELARMEAQMSGLGAVVGGETVEALDRANRQMEIASMQMRAALAPATAGAAQGMSWLARQIAAVAQGTAQLPSLFDRAVEAHIRLAEHVLRRPLRAPVVLTFDRGSGRELDMSQDGAMRGAAPTGGRSVSARLPPPPFVRAPSPPPPVRSTAARAVAPVRAARSGVQDAARRAAEADQQALSAARLDQLRAERDMAQTAAERAELSRTILLEEARQAQQAVTANTSLTETTRQAQREAIAARLAADLAEQRRGEQEAARQAALEAERQEEARAEAARELREQQHEQEREGARVVQQANELNARTARENAVTRAELRDADLALLDIVTQRQLAEIELLKITEEEKAIARAAVNAAAASEARQIEERSRSGAAAYVAELEREARSLNDRLADMAEGGLRDFEDALVSIADGSKDAKDAFADMARGILADLIRLATRQWVIYPLMQMLGLGGGGSGGAPVPSGGGGRRASGGLNIMGVLNALIPGGGFGGFRAEGGPVSPGRAYVIGERGPELLMPRDPGYVVNAQRAQALMRMGALGGPGARGAGVGLTVNVYGAPSGTQVTQRGDVVDVVLGRLDAVERRVGEVDRGVEQRALIAYADARRRGY